MTRSLIIFTLISGCTDPLLGDWECDSGDDDYPNTLTVHGDLSAEATMYFSIDGDNYSADFDADARWTEEGLAVFDMNCDGECWSLDFDMDCTLAQDGSFMSCDGDDLWSQYDFDWEKVGDAESFEYDDEDQDDAICSEGARQCGDENGSGTANVFECIGGDWERVQSCGWDLCIDGSCT